jgi:hypothetical protein
MEKVKLDKVNQIFMSCQNFHHMVFFLASCEEVYSVTPTDVYSDLPDSCLCLIQPFAGSFAPVVMSGGF